MANIVTQKTIFDYSEIEILGDLERLLLCIRGIDDSNLVNLLKKERGNGRNDYPVEVMLNLIYAMKVFSHKSVESFRRELSRNSQLRKVCGLNDTCIKKKHVSPPARVFSGFMKKLVKYENELDDIFNELVDNMYDLVEGFGETIAGDGKVINGYAKKKAKEYDHYDNRTDVDADYVKKDYHYVENGIEKKVSKTYFGYKAHIICDVKTELPIAVKVTKASKNEKNTMKEMFDELDENIKSKAKYGLFDRGYDSTDFYKLLISSDIKPIIDNRHLWDNPESRQYKDTNLYYNQKGEVFIVDENHELQEMKYKGYDKERDALRFSYNGKVYRIKREIDERIFTPLCRNSKKFKRLYKGRTSVERLNGRLDRDYMFEDHFIRGLNKMSVMVKLSMIIMLSMAKAHIDKKQNNLASLLNI